MNTADRLIAARCQLLLVDFQARLMPVIHDGPDVLRRAVMLADAARLLGVPVHGTEQNPRGLGPNDPVVRQRCASTLVKMHFDACEDGLLQTLDQTPASPELVVAGCEAHVCLLQTALGLRRAGRRVWVVADACGSRRAADHALAMQRLRDAGVTLVSTEMVLFEWAHDCRHPAFKDLLALVKNG